MLKVREREAPGEKTLWKIYPGELRGRIYRRQKRRRQLSCGEYTHARHRTARNLRSSHPVRPTRARAAQCARPVVLLTVLQDGQAPSALNQKGQQRKWPPLPWSDGH
jgi:hypothetical protein